MSDGAVAVEAKAADGLGALVGKSTAWAMGSNLVMRFAGIAVTALLARLLSKEDFGTFAVALAVFLVVGTLAELGMGSAVARSADEPADIAPTVTTISIGLGTALAVGMALGAAPLARMLGQPDAAEPLLVLSLSLVLTGVFAVPAAQQVRLFRQDRIFVATVVGFLVANPLLVVVALNGGGATAFAWSRVIGQLASGLVILTFAAPRYRPGWRRQAVPGLLMFGLPLSLANLVNMLLLNADFLVIGRLLDAAEVGVYVIAFNVASWSTALLGSVLNQVALPAFGRVQGSRDGLAAAIVASSRLVGLLALPVGAVTIVLADPLVRTLFGDPWRDAAPVLAVLAVYGVAYSLSLLLVNALIAVGDTMLLLWVQVLWVATLVPAILVGLKMGGLVGVAWAHVVVILAVAMPCYLAAVKRTSGVQLRRLLAALARPALAAAVAATAAWLVNALVPGQVFGLLGGGSAAVACYLVLQRRDLAAVLGNRRSSVPHAEPATAGSA